MSCFLTLMLRSGHIRIIPFSAFVIWRLQVSTSHCVPFPPNRDRLQTSYDAISPADVTLTGEVNKRKYTEHFPGKTTMRIKTLRTENK